MRQEWRATAVNSTHTPPAPARATPAQAASANPVRPVIARHATGASESGVLNGLVERVIQVVIEEIDCLRANRLDDLPRLTERKGQALLEIMRHERLRPGSKPDPMLVAAMGRLRSKLDINQRLLKNHIGAVVETTRILSQSFAESEGDGTYTPFAGRAGGLR